MICGRQRFTVGYRLLVVCAPLLGVLGCDAWLTKPALTNTVEVIATRRNGDPVPGVSLLLYTGQRPMGYATTGSDGKYTFERVPQGFYGVFATPTEPYELKERTFGGPPTDFVDGLVVTNGTLFPVRFTFLKRGPGTVLARVVDAGGSPLSGVTAFLYSPTKVLDTVLTDASGLATFLEVPFGAYGVAITRPLLYRSYRSFDDSLYAFRDGLLVEADSKDSVRFSLQRCSGQVRFHVNDQQGNPMVGVRAVLYTSTEVVANAVTAANGIGVFAAPCLTPLGTIIIPPAGYTIPDGRGSQFFDGFSLASGGAIDFTFTLRKP